jgi:alpha-N-arabinofuranosidase
MRRASVWIGVVAVSLALAPPTARCQETAIIRIDPGKTEGEISPNIFGQFIEHLGRSITGGIFQEGSPLSDSRGFRRDVLEKIRALRPSVLRFPGGTYTKVYHWKDGIGPVANRPKRKNLIWGGIEDNRFGTDEYIEYCREVSCEPFIVVNMGSGTPEEAADWVEYCNGSGDTYYANLRRANGHSEPYNVKFWGLGNEEYAMEDAGHLQDPNRFVFEGWQFAKLMKLTDPSIKLVLSGNIMDTEWNRTLLKGMGPVCDYLSIHYYAGTRANEPWSVYQSIATFDTLLRRVDTLLAETPARVDNFPYWYRFPARQEPIGISVDEWGIWESGGKGPYGLENSFHWRHALATASYLNLFVRSAATVRMATWSQTVNVLGCIMSDNDGSICQTVYYPLQYYRRYCSGRSVHVTIENPGSGLSSWVPALDAAAAYDASAGTVTLLVVNRDPGKAVKTRVDLKTGHVTGRETIEITGESIESANTLNDRKHSVVTIKKESIDGPGQDVVLRPASITICVFRLNNN